MSATSLSRMPRGTDPIEPGPSVMLMASATAAAIVESHALAPGRSEEHTSELQSPYDIVCRPLLEKKKHPAPNGAGTPTDVQPIANADAPSAAPTAAPNGLTPPPRRQPARIRLVAHFAARLLPVTP